jgi:NAD(P)-dependent dehydrogenase (short-subunit alcohol dehydrogenase family)
MPNGSPRWQHCAEVSLLVNDAGVLRYSAFINAPSLDSARAETETNYFGTLSMCRAFAPVLAANGGGAIVNMLSVSSFFTNLIDASYGAFKAAAWSLTNGIRFELHQQGTLVVAVHASFVDTDMAAPATNVAKDSRESVAQQTFDAVETGQVEVLADERTRTVKAQLSRVQELIYPPVQKFWDDALKGGGQPTSRNRGVGEVSARRRPGCWRASVRSPTRRLRVPGPVGRVPVPDPGKRTCVPLSQPNDHGRLRC